MITIDKKHLDRAELLLGSIPGGAPKAVANALNRAAEGARTEAVRKVRERYYIKAKDIRDTMQITKATPDNLSVIIRATGSPIALSKFKITPSKPPAKRRKNPVIARVVKGQGGPIAGAFVTNLKSGHIGVFRRAGEARLPIVQHYGPSVPQMLGHESVTTYVEEQTLERFEKRLDHEVSRMLGGGGK